MSTEKLNNLERLKSLVLTNERTIVTVAAVAATTTASIIYASKATTVVAGATAAPGAIATASNGTMVLSKVAMGLGGKIIIGTLLAATLSYIAFNLVNVYYDNKQD
jgi:hypothetical protein